MVSDTNGPLLTDTKKDVLRGEYDSGTRQARDGHEGTIRKNAVGALRDLRFLFNFLGQEELEKAIGGDAERDDGLVSYDYHTDVPAFASYSLEHVDDEGDPHDPEHSPDTKTKLERDLIDLDPTGKATLEMQKTLIDCVAFLCRTAEAGRLDVQEVIERGVERYYRGHPSKDRQIANLRTWREGPKGGRIKANHEGPASFEIPDAGQGIFRYLGREGYSSGPD